MMTGASGPRTVTRILSQAVFELEAAGVQEPRTDAELLLAHCLGTTRTGLYLAATDVVPALELGHFFKLLTRRKQREPLAYITGDREFWSRSFRVSPDVLIPRPETEFLLETALARRNQAPSGQYCLDLCCGSGIIAVILARELKQQVVAVDISSKALAIAGENSHRHHVEHLVSLVQADLGACFRRCEPFSLVVSNPPYVTTAELSGELQPEVIDHEPRLALDGGRQGLDHISRIVDSMEYLLAPGADLFMEIGASQWSDIRSMLDRHPASGLFDSVQVYKDYAGRDRVVHVRKTR